MIILCFGTRPEVIKLSPIITELKKRNQPFKTIFSGQHKQLYEDVKQLIPSPNYNLGIMKQNQSINDVLFSISKKLPPILKKENARLVIVQGDTSTALSSALVAFNEGIEVGHVEAGLRTYNLKNPFPEEGNRQLISRISKYNWAPTKQAKQNLEDENIKNVILTGNTIIDVCQAFRFKRRYRNKVLVTLHRRENFGDTMKTLFDELETVSCQHPELEFIFPMHHNPNVQQYKHRLTKVNVIAPLKYKEMIQLISEVKFVISDSGGIQEECAFFRKKILVCRKTTERPEGISVGITKLVGKDILNHFDWANDNPEVDCENPYGNGDASCIIVDSIWMIINKSYHIAKI